MLQSLLDQQIDGEALRTMGQNSTSDHMKEFGLVTIHDQLKSKKLVDQLHSTATMHSTTADIHMHGVKGKRTPAQIKKMSAEEK